MRFRTGIIVGGAVGYYLGAKAGRQRYEQLNRMLHKVGESAPVQEAVAKARAATGRTNGDEFDQLTVDLLEPEWTG